MNSMAASTATSFRVPVSVPGGSAVSLRPCRRRITPQAGHALEILGHAIEYLTDELIHQGWPLSADNGQLKAVQLLMALNRQVYYECPIVPTWAERLKALLRR